MLIVALTLSVGYVHAQDIGKAPCYYKEITPDEYDSLGKKFTKGLVFMKNGDTIDGSIRRPTRYGDIQTIAVKVGSDVQLTDINMIDAFQYNDVGQRFYVRNLSRNEYDRKFYIMALDREFELSKIKLFTVDFLEAPKAFSIYGKYYRKWYMILEKNNNLYKITDFEKDVIPLVSDCPETIKYIEKLKSDRQSKRKLKYNSFGLIRQILLRYNERNEENYIKG